MRALLLAAGLGTRLRPLTEKVPKCLVPIHGQALIDYWFEMLFDGGIDRVLVNTGYLAEVVRQHVRACRWSDRIDLTFEAELLGTGGTVLANRPWFGSDPFIVAHADNLSLFSVRDFIARHLCRPENTDMTMMTFDTDAPKTCGIVELDSEARVIGFHEKVENPPGNRANGAVYIFEPMIMNMLSALNKPVIDLSNEILPQLVGRIATFHNDIYHRDIGTPESLARGRAEFNRSDLAAKLRHSGDR